MRAEGAEIAECLNEVGLALPVPPDDEVRAGAQLNVGDRIIAEVTETQMRNEHGPNFIGLPLTARRSL
jgi:hypothetical protein